MCVFGSFNYLHIATYHLPSIVTGVCEAEPEGVLSPLVTFNVPSFVFGIEPIQVPARYARHAAMLCM